MRGIVKTVAIVIAALLGTALLAVTTTFTAALTLSATAIIVPGTGTPDPTIPTDYMNNAVNYYVIPNAANTAGSCDTSVAGNTCTQVPVKYYAQFWPIPLPGWGGLEGQKWNVSVGDGLKNTTTVYNGVTSGEKVVFGYSQGATVSSLFKQQLIDGHMGVVPVGTSFVLIGNPQRPNGGFFERWAILGTVPILDATFGQPTPNTGIDANGNEIPNFPVNTTDIALQYDGVADFPTYPINLLSTFNAIAGFQYIHGTYLAPDGDEVGQSPLPTPYGYTPAEIKAIQDACQANSTGPNCQKYGDTLYITIPARVLPIYQPALDLGAATGTSALVIPLVDLVSPFTQTLIETGYDRTNYGVATPARLIPRINPITLTTDLIKDIPEGIHAALNPGLDPLPGSTPSPAITTLSEPAATTQGPTANNPKRRPLTPLNLIARPNVAGATAQQGQSGLTSLTQPFGPNVHPVRDVAKAVAGAAQSAAGVVKKVLGVKGNEEGATSAAGPSSSAG